MTAVHELYCSEAVRQLDRAAIEAGTPAYELMRRAGAAAFAELRRRWPAARRLLVLCGPGNNGGDGYVVAALAHEAGLQVDLLSSTANRAGPGPALQARELWERYGAVQNYQVGRALPAADVLVDALFGIGINRAIEGPAAELIAAINAQSAPVFALDVPSGIDADRGSAPGPAVRAACTLSFVAAKRGLYTGAGRAHAGEVLLDRLGLPAQSTPAPDACLIPNSLARDWLAPRADDAHKNRFGHVLAIGGDLGMGGALRLCAEAALRCGAGLLSALTRTEHVVALLAGRPEVMVHGLGARPELPPELLRASDVLALGPGLGRADWGRALFDALIDDPRPKVVDADALYHLADAPRSLPAAVITPHPGEAARLLGCSTAEIQQDRFAAARSLARRFDCAAVLKGNGSLVARADGRVEVVAAGNPGLATAGSGDVLTGVIAALLAQGLDSFDAARLGALLHAQAGDRAALEGQRGLVAGDLFAPLRWLVNPCS